MPSYDRSDLDRMNSNPKGWKLKELAAVYARYGFESVEANRHVKFKHHKLPGRFAMVTRSSGELSMLYVKDAIRLITELISLEEGPTQ